jgi:hypothetical protein
MKISPAQKATRPITLTAEHVKNLCSANRDFHPLHCNEVFAPKQCSKSWWCRRGGLTNGLMQASDTKSELNFI